jgi:hypothetical protein
MRQEMLWSMWRKFRSVRLRVVSRSWMGVVAGLWMVSCGGSSDGAPPSQGETPDSSGISDGAAEGAALQDASAVDTGVRGANDASSGDAGTVDTGTVDTGPRDSGAGDGSTLVDSGETPDAGSDNVLPAGCAPDGGHGGDRWQDLYHCYFGPTGVANCSLNSTCHGTGAGAAAIWTCGATSAQCYAGMVSGMLVPDGGAHDATMTLLYFSLRKADGSGGSMPQIPEDVTFDTQDLARIDAWIMGGAPNN